MDQPNNPSNSLPHRHRTNWHEAAVCAIQITLRDYGHLLEYLSEFPLGHNAYRIDLLIIRKLSGADIPHAIARIFRSYNLFEIKGVHSSITIAAYYKTIGYASLLIAADSKSPPHQRQDISLSLLCHRVPGKLFRHLEKDCKKTIANPYPGIYYISEDIYPVQVIVTGLLPPEDALYLRCLTDRLEDKPLIDRLVNDYSEHLTQPVYKKYMDQLAKANFNPKGVSSMAICCEGIFMLCGTSSKEIEERAWQAASAQQAEKYTAIITEQQNEIARLKALLAEKEQG